MGSIYKQKVTPEEMHRLIKMIPGRKIDNEIDYEINMSGDLKLADLYRLFSIRGEKDKAQGYFEKIEDNVLRYLLKN